MDVKALVAILAVSVLIEELALAHLSQIVFVKIITCISFFAEALEPVFAHIVVVVAAIVMLGLLSGSRMAIRTSTTTWAVAGRGEVGTDRDCRGKGSQAACSKERCKTEVVGGLRWTVVVLWGEGLACLCCAVRGD